MTYSFKVPFVRSAFNYDPAKVSDETGLACLDPSKAQQSARDETDINTIVMRFGLTGQLPNDVRAPQYGDFTGVSDYRSALHAVMAAEESFMQLPANVRYRFQNDAAQFVDFCSNPANAAEMKSLGLLVDKPQSASADVAASGGVTNPPVSGG